MGRTEQAVQALERAVARVRQHQLIRTDPDLAGIGTRHAASWSGTGEEVRQDTRMARLRAIRKLLPPAAGTALCWPVHLRSRSDGDLWFHLAYGRFMVENRTLVPDRRIQLDPCGQRTIYCAWIPACAYAIPRAGRVCVEARTCVTVWSSGRHGRSTSLHENG